MKSKTKKRLIAFMLCMVLVLSSAISAFADDLDTQAQDQTTTMADEPVATSMDDSTDEQQPVAEAEENQEQAVETQEEQQTEENVSEEPTTEDSSAVAEQEAIEKESDVSIQTTVNGTTITMSGPHSSFPEGTTYEISASELNEDETKDVEIALKKKEDENDIKIATYKAYDIKLLVDGVESQPTGDVNVKFEGGEVTENITDSEKVDVYHVDEHNQVANTVTETATTETVTMTTNHFSTYVITTTTDAGVEITVQHYLQNPKKQLYRDSTVHLAKGQKIEDLSSLMNYKAEKVVKINTIGSEGAELRGNEVITENQTYRVYYSATTGNSNESVQMFDYQVKGDNNVSINDANNYSSSSSDTTRFASGLANKQYSGNGYNTTINVNGSTVYINTWDQKSGGGEVNHVNSKVFGNGNAATGIIKGVNFNTGALIMGKNSSNEQMYEPGFFTNDPKPGKQILSGYKLNFNRNGDTYTLTGVNKPDGSSALSGYDSNTGSNFFPLDSIRDLHKDKANDPEHHNCFFGMRYDIEFTIGDYLGDLNYSFTGDDDLWAILDAKKDGGQVVIDLGGIHSALDKKVDLWEILLNKKDYKEKDKLEYADRDKKHTLTILYMERGAYESNCKMNFTLPNSRIVTPSTIPTADLNLKKVNTSEKGIANTTFKLVNDTDLTEVKTATSDTDGNITFEELREGTYTLSEESVPKPYVRETSTWKVKVKKSEGTALTAVLYDTTGETAKEKNADGTYHIVNLTKEEHTQQSMDYNKTAHVTDWDARKYDIDITASSKITSQTTQETGGEANVMLVLDTSGSMGENLSSQIEYKFYGKNTADTRDKMSGNNYYLKIDDQYVKIDNLGFFNNDWRVNNKKLNAYSSDYEIYTRTTINTTRMDALKAAAIQFINNTAEKSPNSKIGISVFSSNGFDQESGYYKGCNGKSQDLLQVGIPNNTTKLTSFINNLYTGGGTDPQIGLNNAKEKLESVKTDNLPQYVILFTDGAPTGNRTDNNWDSNAKSNSETAASNLKNNGVTVYTIGFALDSRAQTYLAGGTYNGETYPGIASPGCAQTADTADSLLDIFNKISETITNNLEIHNATIVDAIDPRFVILDDKGNQITPEYLDKKPNKQVTLENGGTVYYENGIQYIKWTEQTLPKHSENKQWKQTIHVQAQTDYIGGNNVPTNISPNSKITTTEFGDTPLPQPKVNVKAELTLNDKEITIYKGDDVPTADTVLADMVQNYTKNTTSYGISKDSFTVQWYSSEQLEESEKINTAVIGTKVENDTTYYLTVTYNAGAPSPESNTNTTITKDDGLSEAKHAGNETTYQVVAAGDQNRGYGIYTIHVISGTINITKNLTDPAKEDHTFQFEVKCGDTVITVPITVEKGKKTATITNEDALNKLTALPRGTYTVTEKEDSNTGYILNGSEVNENTNCENSSKNNSVTFVLGNSKDKENVIEDYTYAPSSGGTRGDVTFTNEKVIKNWDIVKVSTSSKNVKLQDAEFILTDSNKTTYIGTSGSDGKITWKDADSNSVPVLPGGTYTFKETKAPVGYAVNPETWTIKISSTNGYLKSITKADGTEITGTETDSLVHYYFEDEAVYALPSAGGTGIYLYMIGGMLLMFAAVWILYKNKCKEVLGK